MGRRTRWLGLAGAALLAGLLAAIGTNTVLVESSQVELELGAAANSASEALPEAPIEHPFRNLRFGDLLYITGFAHGEDGWMFVVEQPELLTAVDTNEVLVESNQASLELGPATNSALDALPEETPARLR